MSPELIDLDEICGLFDCTESTIIAMLRVGDLPGVKFGRDWRIPRNAFWHRVNELALEDAAVKRQPVQSGILAGKPEVMLYSAPPVTARPRGRPRSPT